MDTTPTALGNGLETETLASDISREIVGLHKRYFGRGPVHIRTHVLGDCVLVLMSGTHAPSERALAALGRPDLPAQTRSAIHNGLRAAYVNVIEQRIGRRVIGFMPDSQADADLECQVYALEAAGATAPSANGSEPGP